MSTSNTQTRWQQRLSRIESKIEQIRFPDELDHLEQDEEWCDVFVDGHHHRIRFHDYHEVFAIPGLYEELFCERLGCCSPERVVGLLMDVLDDCNDGPEALCVLDVGAGNGMVGDELQCCGVNQIVGIDIIGEAREAAHRDRPEVYSDYLIADLADLPEPAEERLRATGFNCLTTVAALGFGDMPPEAFIKALDLIETPGWIAFNVKEEFLHEGDHSGFCRLIPQLNREQVIQIQAYRRYQHRLSLAGEPLYYVAMIARKLRDVPDHLLAGD